MDYKKGFTLLEILVAITIFSIAIALVSYSFRHSINIVKYLNFSYAEDLQKLSKLRDSIVSTFFFLTQDDSKINEKSKIFKFFFKGNESSVEYITCKPLLVKDREIVLSRIRKEGDTLIIEEYPVYDKEINYKKPSFDGIKPKKEVVLKNVEKIKFSYLKDQHEFDYLNGTIPDAIKLVIKKLDQKKSYTFIFKIKTNTFIKKEIGESLYEAL